MRIIADFHLHSKYSRATSKNLNLSELAKWSRIKGVNLAATGDFTHPKYIEEIKSKLVSDGLGLFNLKSGNQDIKFILSTEVACIYKHKGATRRLHHLILAPDIQSVERINKKLTSLGCNITADGRPILGLTSKQLLEVVLEANSENVLVPAHVWTPWFAIFGSKSGYDTVEDCFEDLSKYIFALETGLSSDPEMNWALSQLDKYTLISNSDAHSGPNIGREANVFELKEISYSSIIKAIKNKNPKDFLYTIEFFPEEGMYHIDGHRSCKVSFMPEKTKKMKNICPVCKKPLTVGVLHRVDNLKDRKFGYQPPGAIPFKKITPLPNLISDYYGMGKQSKKVQTLFYNIISQASNEFEVLLDTPLKGLKKIMPAGLAAGIIKVREQKVNLEPGFDGVYGKVHVFSVEDRRQNLQKSLF